MPELVRLNKHLAHSSGLSRRQADEYIQSGRVKVNGKTASLGNVIRPGKDTVEIDTSEISRRPVRYTYVLCNKPTGYVCSRRQQGDTPTVYALLPRQYQALKIAGRLDKDSCGLVLLTDDGDMIFKLTHPKFAKKKVYRVGLNKPLKPEHKKQIESGIELDDGVSTLHIANNKSKLPNTYTVTMYEGRNRQIRRTFKALGYSVTHLERTQLGAHKLSELGTQKYLQIS